MNILFKSSSIVVFIFLCCTLSVKSQDISGLWEGNFTDNTVLAPYKVSAEINVYKDSLITGLSHLYYSGNRYEHYKINGIYRKKQKLFIIIEVSTIMVNLGAFGNCLGTYVMKMETKGNTLLQRGYWHPNDANCGATTTFVWLQKNIPVPPPKIAAVKKAPDAVKKGITQNPVAPDKALQKNIPQQIAPTVATPPTHMPSANITTVTSPKITNRQTDVQSLVEIPMADKDSIKVQVYDNGTIDGDSVSVFVDKTERISRKKITDKPITFYVTLNKNINPLCNIRLVAESMGSIPPCTALMIITTKSKRYEVKLSSNFNKNATVELFLKE